MIDVMVGRHIPDENERLLEATWISEKLTDKIVSTSDFLTDRDELAKSLVQPIKSVLEFMQVQ